MCLGPGQGRPRLAELVWASALPPADQGNAFLDPYSETLESGVSQECPRGAWEATAGTPFRLTLVGLYLVLSEFFQRVILSLNYYES